MSNTAVVLRNTGAQVLGQFLGTCVSLATFVILSRALGPAGYGDYVVVTTYLGCFAIGADWGLYLLVLRSLAEEKDVVQQRRAYGRLLAFRISLSLAALLLGILVSQGLPYSGLVQRAIALGSVLFLMTNTMQVVNAIFQAHLRAHLAALLDVLLRTLQFAVVLTASRAGFGLLEIVGGIAAASVLVAFLAMLLSRKYLPFTWRDIEFNLRAWRWAFGACWALGLSSLLSVLLFKLHAVLLSLYATSEVMGVYGLAWKVMEILSPVSGAFIGAAFPILTRYWSAGDPRFETGLQRTFTFVLILAVLIPSVSLAMLEPIVLFLGGAAFEASAPVLGILVLGLGLGFLSSLFFHLGVIMDRQVPLIWCTAAALALNVGLNLVFIPRYSYWAAAAIAVGTEAMRLAMNGALVLQRQRLRFLAPSVVGPVLLAAGPAYLLARGAERLLIPDLQAFEAASRLQQMLRLVGVGAVGLAGFALLTLLTRVVRKEDLKLLWIRS